MESATKTANGLIETPPYSHDQNQGNPLRTKERGKRSYVRKWTQKRTFPNFIYELVQV